MQRNSALKKNLFEACSTFLKKRKQIITRAIDDLEESLYSETKSSAGDKHETGRAMIQLEREKLGNQLAELQKTEQILNKINPNLTQQHASFGSIVFSSNMNFFISISAGRIEMANNIFYAIASDTPIAQLLMGKAEGDTVHFRNDTFVIVKVL